MPIANFCYCADWFVSDLVKSIKCPCDGAQLIAFLAHLSRRLVGELIVYLWSGVSPSSFTISNVNISATSGPITMKSYQKHHWDGGLP